MKKKFTLKGLECANCAAKMEKAINELDGVKEATVNFMTQKLVIEGEDEKNAYNYTRSRKNREEN